MGTLLPSVLSRLSEIKGIFHLLLDRVSGEMDWEFKKIIEEYDESTEDWAGSAGDAGGA